MRSNLIETDILMSSMKRYRLSCIDWARINPSTWRLTIMNIAQRLIPTLQMTAQLYYRYRKTTILWIHPFKMFQHWCLILMIKLRSKLRLQTHLLSTLQTGFQVPRGNYVSYIWSTITITYSLWFNLWDCQNSVHGNVFNLVLCQTSFRHDSFEIDRIDAISRPR